MNIGSIDDLAGYGIDITEREREIKRLAAELDAAKKELAAFRAENDPKAAAFIMELKKILEVQTVVTPVGVFKVTARMDKIERKSDSQIVTWCRKHVPWIVREEQVTQHKVDMKHLREIYFGQGKLPAGAEFIPAHQAVLFTPNGAYDED